MTGRVSRSGSIRWSRSVASPITRVTNQAPKSTNASGSPAEPQRQQPEGERPGQRRRRRPPVDRTPRRMLLVMLRPARREPVGRQAEGEPAGPEQRGQWLHQRSRTRRRRGAAGGEPAGQPARAPASASSTSVACDAPVAPRGAYDVALRK